jgi:hypothetical protein
MRLACSSPTAEVDVIQLTKAHESQLALNDELDTICGEIVANLDGRWETLNIVDQFLIELFIKSHRTFQSLHILARQARVEDALCLLRVLVETTINFGYAIKGGPVEAFKRYHDWAVIDSIKRRRVQGVWKGGITKTDEAVMLLQKIEAEIKTRRTDQEIEDFKRKGVYGVSLEERARVSGEEKLYDGSYRITSRNSHAIDVIEFRRLKDTLGEREFNEFFEIRLDHLLSVARYCLGSNAQWTDAQYGCGLGDRLKSLNQHDTFSTQF